MSSVVQRSRVEAAATAHQSTTGGRHGRWRAYRPDTQAASAEEAGVRRALSKGTIALAPRTVGWDEVRERDGVLIEAPALDPDGLPVGVWDAEALSRWMRGGPARRGRGVLSRLAAVFGR
jgi:hypothetical protein